MYLRLHLVREGPWGSLEEEGFQETLREENEQRPDHGS